MRLNGPRHASSPTLAAAVRPRSKASSSHTPDEHDLFLLKPPSFYQNLSKTGSCPPLIITNDTKHYLQGRTGGVLCLLYIVSAHWRLVAWMNKWMCLFWSIYSAKYMENCMNNLECYCHSIIHTVLFYVVFHHLISKVLHFSFPDRQIKKLKG